MTLRNAGKFYLGVLAALLLGCCTSMGCRTPGPYALGQAENYRIAPQLAAITEPQFERGEPRPIIDGIGWVIGIPGKVLMWDRRVDNHNISAQTEEVLAEYLAANELTAVKVRINEYAPGDEWRRLVANKSVGAGWRYTLGGLGWIGYTIFPGRIWGGDNYNPFSNTINIYSDVPAFAVHEGGHAKDFSRRRYPGTYAAAYVLIPGVPLWHEAIASRDALAYFHEYASLEEEQQAYRNLAPAYGSYVGSTAASFVSDGLVIPVQAAAIVGGHILGRIEASKIARDEIYRLPPASDSGIGEPPSVPDDVVPMEPRQPIASP